MFQEWSTKLNLSTILNLIKRTKHKLKSPEHRHGDFKEINIQSVFYLWSVIEDFMKKGIEDISVCIQCYMCHSWKTERNLEYGNIPNEKKSRYKCNCHSISMGVSVKYNHTLREIWRTVWFEKNVKHTHNAIICSEMKLRLKKINIHNVV